MFSHVASKILTVYIYNLVVVPIRTLLLLIQCRDTKHPGEYTIIGFLIQANKISAIHRLRCRDSSTLSLAKTFPLEISKSCFLFMLLNLLRLT